MSRPRKKEMKKKKEKKDEEKAQVESESSCFEFSLIYIQYTLPRNPQHLSLAVTFCWKLTDATE